MKKFLSIFAILVMLVLNMFSPSILFSSAEEVYYAKIMQENVYFFSSPHADYKMFILPASYFVKLLSSPNDNFYYAQYKDVYGYVQKTDVTVMDGTPQNPYNSSTFRVFSLDGLPLYSSAYVLNSNKISEIPYLTKNIEFYGKFYGEEAIPEKGNLWYYCKYTNNQDYHGYVYSIFCDKLSTQVLNNEYFEVITTPIFQPKVQPSSSVSTPFIVLAVTIPCLIVLYLLIKPNIPKIKQNPKRSLKSKGKKDYFEFSDSDLT